MMFFANMVGSAVTAAMSMMFAFIPSGMLGIAAYVLSSLALYTLATRRGISNPWLSWVPVGNVWILGSLSDQYRYVVKGQYRSKRKLLLGLKLASVLFLSLSIGQAVAGIVQMRAYGAWEDVVLKLVLGGVIPVLCLSVVTMVVRYMALYDVYTSMGPGNNVLFLVLSIFFRIMEPFFLFFNREKDDGMPPRKPPIYEN